MTWRWIHEREVMAIHGELVVEHGGDESLRDRGLLSSALARPRHKASYGKASVFDLAAAYAFAIIRNHPFVDGNKRTGFVVASAFLILNGWNITAPEAEAYSAIMALTEGTLNESEFSKWLRDHSRRRARSGRRRSV
jgi:death on curing protein